MELKEFIKTTLIEITNGVIEAQKELADSDCLINPMVYSSSSNQIWKGVENNSRTVQTIKMNIVLDVLNSKENSSGIGVAKFVNAGFDKVERKNEKELTSVEFEIPISFPVMTTKK